MIKLAKRNRKGRIMNFVSWFYGFFFLVCTSLIYQSSYASLAVSAKSEPRAEADCQFLFKYYDLSPLLATIPKDVQFGISGHLRDLFVGYFTPEKPYKELGQDGDEISAFAFSRDDSYLAYGVHKADDYRRRNGGYGIPEPCIRLLNLNEEESVPQKVTTDRKIVMNVVFNADGTRLAFRHSDLIYECRLNNFHVVEGPHQISSLDPLLERAPVASLDGIKVHKANANYRVNEVMAITYTVKGQLAFATSSMEVFILSDDRNGCEDHVVDTQHPFILNTPMRNVFTGEIKQALVLKSAMSADGSYAAFMEHQLDTVVVCDYQNHVYRSFSSEDLRIQLLPRMLSLSYDGRFLATGDHHTLEDFRAHKVRAKVCVWDALSGRRLLVLEVLDDVGGMSFSPDSAFLLVSCGGSWNLYHLTSQRLVARKILKENFNNRARETLNAFNNSGNLFAVAQNNKPFKHALWKTNPLWKQLDELWTGRLTIEQVLFIIFLREMQSKGLLLDQALPEIVKKYTLSPDEIKSSLSRIFKSFSDPIKRYLYCLLGTKSDQPGCKDL